MQFFMTLISLLITNKNYIKSESLWWLVFFGKMLLHLTLPLYSISILSGKLDGIKLENGLGLIWQVKRHL